MYDNLYRESSYILSVLPHTSTRNMTRRKCQNLYFPLYSCLKLLAFLFASPLMLSHPLLLDFIGSSSVVVDNFKVNVYCTQYCTSQLLYFLYSLSFARLFTCKDCKWDGNEWVSERESKRDNIRSRNILKGALERASEEGAREREKKIRFFRVCRKNLREAAFAATTRFSSSLVWCWVG